MNWLLYNLIHMDLARVAAHLNATAHGAGWRIHCLVKMVKPRKHAHYKHGAPVWKLLCTGYLGKK